MAEIGLVEAIASLRAELAEAVAEAEGRDIQFPVDNVELEFQVGVTRDLQGGGKLRFWVLELGASGGIEARSVQKVTIGLGTPVDAQGQTLKIRRRLHDKRLSRSPGECHGN
jgi:hypothetical protein